MNFQYNCPECKKELSQVENVLHCNNCLKHYKNENNFIIFENNNKPIISNNDKSIKKLLEEIKNSGFKIAIKNFLILNQELESNFINTEYDKSADIIFHGIGNNYSRCLDINSQFGNKSEILSNIFKQVYSIEQNDEYIELQKMRFKEKKCHNISISKCDLLKLPFPDDFFDLVLCNGVLNEITKFIETNDQDENQKKMVLELKRVINEKGCIIFGVNNRGLKINWKFYKSGLKKSSKQKFSKYMSIFKNSDLIVKSLWVFPSYNQPYYSGEISDNIALKSFFRNISIFMASFRGGKHQNGIIETMLSFLKKINYPFIKTILQLFAPSFIFCCSKIDNQNSLENWIKKETGYQNILRMSRHEKILFMLLNIKGEIEKAVYIKRYGYDFPNKIKLFERNFPNIKEPTDRIWMVNWIKGRTTNPNNEKEIMLIIDWLIEFQKNTKLDKMNKDDVNVEISFIKNGLKYFGFNELDKYFRWLEQYERFIDENQINMTPVHGDFWFPNILYDSQTEKINIIDWETYSEKGNPFEDFMWFLCNLMGMSSKKPLETFRENLENRGEKKDEIKHIKNKIDLYFGFNLDYILLLRVNLLKWMIIQEQIRERNGGKESNLKEIKSTLHTKMLEILSEY